MNYHLMVADKFIDSYIDDVHKLNLQHINKFWVLEKPCNNRYIKNNIDKVKWVGSEYKLIFDELTSLLQSDDKIIIHWCDMNIGRVIMKLPTNIQIYAYHWGGDFLEDPHPYHCKKWLERKTYDRFIQINKKEMFERLRHGKLPVLISSKILNLKNKWSLYLLFKEKKNQVKRINYFLLHPSNTVDIQLTKKIYGLPDLKTKSSFYDLNFKIAKLVQKEYKATIIQNRKIKILIGNSATDTNNHLDAFDLFKKFENVEIHCPLSYGDHLYKDEVIRKGRELFGKNFIPLEQFLDREQYVNLINNIDIVFMYHIRSQAFGNIITALTLGKPVFLNSKNALATLLANIGITIFDSKLIFKMDLLNLISTNLQNQENNYQILNSHFSDKIRLEFLKQVIC